MANVQNEYPFPIYGNNELRWFRLSEIPLKEQSEFKSWLIDNFLIFEAAAEQTGDVIDGFLLRYYEFWKSGGTVRVIEDLPKPKSADNDLIH